MPAVPGVVQGGHAAYVGITEALVDVQGRNLGPVAHEPLAGEDEVEIEVDEDTAQPAMGGFVDLGEGVVQEDQARRVRCRLGEAGEVGGCRGKEHEVGEDRCSPWLRPVRPVSFRRRPGAASSTTKVWKRNQSR